MITNRERHIARAFIRNSYELTETEIDSMIEDELRDVDVDVLHTEQMAFDALNREEEG
jgi:hypothetical protein